MQDTFARARTRPKGQARATIGYLVYKLIYHSAKNEEEYFSVCKKCLRFAKNSFGGRALRARIFCPFAKEAIFCPFDFLYRCTQENKSFRLSSIVTTFGLKLKIPNFWAIFGMGCIQFCAEVN